MENLVHKVVWDVILKSIQGPVSKGSVVFSHKRFLTEQNMMHIMSYKMCDVMFPFSQPHTLDKENNELGLHAPHLQKQVLSKIKEPSESSDKSFHIIPLFFFNFPFILCPSH